MSVVVIVAAVVCVLGLGVALYGLYALARRLESLAGRMDGLYGGIARLGERLANIEAAGDSARGHSMRASTALPDIAIQLSRLSDNIEEERRIRTEPQPDSWKAGEAALGRIALAKSEFARLEQESYDEWLAGRGK
jgi:hypothetical protein